MLPVSELHIIASRGGGMIIDAAKYTANDLATLASRAAGGGGLIILRNASRLTAEDAKVIASRGQGKVVFDYM